MKINSPIIVVTCEFAPEELWGGKDLIQINRRVRFTQEFTRQIGTTNRTPIRIRSFYDDDGIHLETITPNGNTIKASPDHTALARSFGGLPGGQPISAATTSYAPLPGDKDPMASHPGRKVSYTAAPEPRFSLSNETENNITLAYQSRGKLEDIPVSMMSNPNYVAPQLPTYRSYTLPAMESASEMILKINADAINRKQE